MTLNRRHLGRIGLGLLGAASLPGLADTFPSRPISFVVPYPPGASSDLTSRLIGQHVAQTIGQSVIVENRGGANGTIGATYVAKSPADGYRLLFATMPMLAINPYVYKNTPIDVNKDLVPVTYLANAVTGISVHPSLGINSLSELIAYARKQPEGILFGSSGTGSAQHLAGIMLGSLTGTKWTHVPYRGAGPMVTDMLAGNVKVGITTLASLAAHIKAGRLKLLAVGEKTRFAQLPDVPTMSEVVPGVAFTAWFGFFAPAGTPREIVERLNTHIVRAANLSSTKEKLADAYIQVVAEGPDALARQIQTDQNIYSKIIREQKIVLD